jgi:Actin
VKQVRRPIDRGYLVNTDLQRDIWAHSLADSLRCGPSDTSLLLTEPVFNLPSIQEATDQVQAIVVDTSMDINANQRPKIDIPQRQDSLQ